MNPPESHSWATATLDLYQQLPEKERRELPELRSALLRVSTCALANEDELGSRVTGFNPSAGWLRCQSQLTVCWDGNWTKCQASGVPLAGELYNGRQSASAILRYTGSGWKWTVLEESNDEKTGCEPFLAQEVELLAENELLETLTGHTGRWKLLYDVYWRVRKGEPTRRAAYRFKGFVKEQG